jgi:hypothetical protein
MSPSTTGHEKPGGNQGGPSSKAKYLLVTDSEEYREGKVKSTPMRGVKESLKPYVYKLWKDYASQEECPTAYLLHHGLASQLLWPG